MLDILRFDQQPGIAHRLVSASLATSLLCLAACQISPEQPSSAPQASPVPSRAAIAEETVRYQILSDLSDVRFLVFRAGPFAKLGHNHVVQAKNIRGEIRLSSDIRQSSLFIEIPVRDFHIDGEEARLDEGAEFFPQPDDEAIAGTARNMFGERVLDAAQYPTIEIASVALNGPAWGMDVTVRIKFHGVEREIVVPTVVDRNGQKLLVTALFSINQSDFGIVPMSVLGGAIQVANTVRVRMRIVAGRVDALPQ